ncbi:group III truncated hemoglobin [Allofranklinella schreckenbergeri]|uniref:Group III truncated hemoglobin n=1 Tax=Allofranklinella schreckenbergeri TaxID=1076744 RepID=A0A3M6PYF9_9BURK|nr:group III truncated hemoglobin [Allofranklinella schreckenbergeri]RMW95474.1 group III truncated hemoglobin [Allofranklinella schreckenbergeri]RRD41646.1 group III truncated hemoglobin [Comamonadaceae bacterium OH3737_COT-264]
MSREHDTICTEAEVRQLVVQFYAHVRADAQLGPVFEAHIDDWPQHLEKLIDFWSGLLRGTTRFEGSPMSRHIALPDLSSALFRHWLALFEQTCLETGNPRLHAKATEIAHRVANRLWSGYQRVHPEAV